MCSSDLADDPSECTACIDAHEYADVAGLTVCKACPAGSYADDAHAQCIDVTCERPGATLPAGASVAYSDCPDHGTMAAVGVAASACAVACFAGYQQSGFVEYTCKPDAGVTASYQGAITCTPCVADVSFAEAAGSALCAPVRVCVANARTKTAGTRTADRVCECLPGFLGDTA